MEPPPVSRFSRRNPHHLLVHFGRGLYYHNNGQRRIFSAFDYPKEQINKVDEWLKENK